MSPTTSRPYAVAPSLAAFPLVRVYLPTTLPLLRGWLLAVTTPTGLTGFAVTPGLREWYAEGDAEELEWAASVLAGRASLRLLASDPAAPCRRAVLAVEVPEGDVAPLDDLERGAVRVARPVPLADWAAGLVDEEAARPVIVAAADSIDAADLGDDDAEFLVSEAEDAELLWWATQELAGLTGGLSAAEDDAERSDQPSHEQPNHDQPSHDDQHPEASP